MPNAFVGTALPLDDDALHAALEAAGIGAAELWAVLDVETAGCGFLPSRRPQLLFERHVFSRETRGRWDASHPEVSGPRAGGYGATGEHQYARLGEALALDPGAALRSASWGIGQVMGLNAAAAGYGSAEEMVQKMLASEGEQLMGMARFLVATRLAAPLRARNWPAFARGYNGASYAANSYDTRLAAAYARFASGGLPDLTVRAAQLLLGYLGYAPGKVDGFLGRLTRAALNAFQEARRLPVTEHLDEVTFAALGKAALG